MNWRLSSRGGDDSRKGLLLREEAFKDRGLVVFFYSQPSIFEFYVCFFPCDLFFLSASYDDGIDRRIVAGISFIRCAHGGGTRGYSRHAGRSERSSNQEWGQTYACLYRILSGVRRRVAHRSSR